jgi:hypothetical protein
MPALQLDGAVHHPHIAIGVPREISLREKFHFRTLCLTGDLRPGFYSQRKLLIPEVAHGSGQEVTKFDVDLHRSLAAELKPAKHGVVHPYDHAGCERWQCRKRLCESKVRAAQHRSGDSLAVYDHRRGQFLVNALIW